MLTLYDIQVVFHIWLISSVITPSPTISIELYNVSNWNNAVK